MTAKRDGATAIAYRLSTGSEFFWKTGPFFGFNPIADFELSNWRLQLRTVRKFKKVFLIKQQPDPPPISLTRRSPQKIRKTRFEGDALATQLWFSLK